MKAFRKEARNTVEFAELTDDYRVANLKTIQLFGILDPGLVLIGNVALAVVLLVGGLRVAAGGLEIGVLLAALLYTRSFLRARAGTWPCSTTPTSRPRPRWRRSRACSRRR